METERWQTDQTLLADQLKGNGEITISLFKITLKIFSQVYNAFCDVQTCFILCYGIKNVWFLSAKIQEIFLSTLCVMLQKSFLAIFNAVLGFCL